MEVTRPAIVKYSDYRAFLADFYRHKKSLRPGFSYRQFASRAGMKSPNYLQLVILGKRNLSDTAAAAVAKAMALVADESRYFCSLVKLANANDDENRTKAKGEVLIAAKQLVTKLIPKAHLEVLKSWYVLLTRELVFLPDFEASGDWISTKLSGLISAEEADSALALLCRGGFLVQDDSGKWRAQDPIIDTGPEGFAESLVTNLHSETLQVWAKNLRKFDPDAREMGLINIPIARDKIPEVQQRLRKFQDELIGWLQDGENADSLIQVGFYLMPLSLATKKASASD